MDRSLQQVPAFAVGGIMFPVGAATWVTLAVAVQQGAAIPGWWSFIALGVAVAGLVLLGLGVAWRVKLYGRPPTWKALNERRVKRYQANRGLFLIHTWEPSELEGQVADVTVRLHQHGPGPLTDGTVEAVEYTLGPRFSDHSTVITDPAEGFAYQDSMYGSMLCLAKVYFTKNRRPLILERYINFEGSRIDKPSEAPSSTLPIDGG